jgi:DNA topoisomerase-6 subunit A
MTKKGLLPVSQKIVDTARNIQDKILKKQKPTMSTPVRSLENVKYHSDDGHFEILGKNKVRTLTVSTVKTFAQTLKMMSLSKELIDTNDMATKRVAYYISKNWGKAGFDEQPESDTIMDDVEAMFGVNREQLKFIPEEKGGEVAGKLVVYDHDAKGNKLKIDCTKFGSGAYSIPIDVENLDFDSNAKFLLAIETAGAFQRLVKYDYWDKQNWFKISICFKNVSIRQ